MHIFGSTLTVVGSFQPVAINQDIKKRGGVVIPELADNTNYVLVGNSLSDSDTAIINEAKQLGVPCISLDQYKEEMPDDLESD